jgi:hypothetical protein
VKIIYTNHARERLKKRRLSEHGLEDTICHPDKKFSIQNDGRTKYVKKQGTRLYHVVAKYLPDQKAYLILSAWVRGEEDRPDFAWQLITAPFRLIGWLVKKGWLGIKKLFGN